MKTFYQFQEDITQRRIAARQQTQDREASAQQTAQSYHVQKASAAKREQLKQEIKKELQTEQTSIMEPNLYNQLIARRQASKRAEMKAIMSR